MRAAHILLAAAAALVSTAPASAALDLRRADISHLPNGLTVILLEDHSFPVVSVQMLYKSGSAAETAGKTGVAHFLEHLVFRGTENFPKGASTELIYDAGGEWHAYTAIDQTTYFETMPRDGLGLLLRIEADRMARVIIDPASIDAEKGAVITELHSYENDPASVLADAVTATAIQAHPYRSPMAGYISDVQRLTAADARAFYAGHYAPSNAVLAIVGDVVPSEAKALVAKTFASVPQRTVAEPNFSVEPPQTGERRTHLVGSVDRQYFNIAFRSPAASSADFPAFLVLQQILSGGSGVNLRQSDWGSTPAIRGSLLYGTAEDVATWLPPMHDPFLFTITGSVPAKADPSAVEREIEKRIAGARDHAVTSSRLSEAKTAVASAVIDDVQTTEDAAHQLAFFEGIGALDILLDLPRRISAVTAGDVQRVARTYLAKERRTVGWMVPGRASHAPSGLGNPRLASERRGQPPVTGPAGQPQLRRLSGGLAAIVQANPFSDNVTVELLLSAPVQGGARPADLPGLDAVICSGRPKDLAKLLGQCVASARKGHATTEVPSEDPTVRLSQLMMKRMGREGTDPPKPLAVIVSGNIEPGEAFRAAEEQLGHTVPARLPRTSPPYAHSKAPELVRERIAKPLSQGAMGYIVPGPPPGTHDALVWRTLLYVLTHDYSGRLGWSAISNKGLVYHIYSQQLTDGARSWVALSTGVDPDKADAMEAELRVQIARLVSEPPSQAEVDAGLAHLLGRDLTAAQSNEELAGKFAREFVETGRLRSHEQLRAELETVTPAELARAAQAFADGTIIRVDVGAGPERRASSGD
jgi:predicted Zn-dependent peptidase